MVDHESADHGSTEGEPVAAPAKRPRGHRPSDARDVVAEMTARAHAISQEAGTRMAQAMKDVINSAAGLTGFAVESARDLLQYMVRRGQMTQSEADRVLRSAEEAHAARQGEGTAPRATAGTAAPSRTSTSSVARPKKTVKGKSSAARPPAARATAPKKGKKK